MSTLKQHEQDALKYLVRNRGVSFVLLGIALACREEAEASRLAGAPSQIWEAHDHMITAFTHNYVGRVADSLSPPTPERPDTAATEELMRQEGTWDNA